MFSKSWVSYFSIVIAVSRKSDNFIYVYCGFYEKNC